MKFEVLVKPNARKEAVEPLPEGGFRVLVTASPQEGEANEAVLKALSKHLGVAYSQLKICIGAKSRRKLVEVRRK